MRKRRLVGEDIYRSGALPYKPHCSEWNEKVAAYSLKYKILNVFVLYVFPYTFMKPHTYRKVALKDSNGYSMLCLHL